MLASAIILIIVLAFVGLAALLLVVASMSRHRKSCEGELGLMDSVVSVVEPLEPEGAVLVRGELWRARTREGMGLGRGHLNARVVGARGHLLEVEPLR